MSENSLQWVKSGGEQVQHRASGGHPKAAVHPWQRLRFLFARIIKLDGYEPHETDWILYVDGEEVARVQERGSVEAEFHKVLLEG